MTTQPIINHVRAFQEFTYSPTLARIDVLYEQEINGVLHTWIKSTLTCHGTNGAYITEERKLPFPTQHLKSIAEVKLTGEIIVDKEGLELIYNQFGLSLKNEENIWLNETID